MKKDLTTTTTFMPATTRALTNLRRYGSAGYVTASAWSQVAGQPPDRERLSPGASPGVMKGVKGKGEGGG